MNEEYNATVLDHFMNPRNIGEISSPSAEGVVDNPLCGDLIKLSLRMEGGIVQEARVKTFGCAAAIAAGSILTVLVRGQSLDGLRAIQNEDIVRALGGLPEHKERCSVLAEQVLHEVLMQLDRLPCR